MRIQPRYLAVAAGALVLAVALSLTVGRLGGPGEGMDPAALQRIVAKNKEAATQAAAAQRAESEASAEAADRAVDRREAEQLGRSQENQGSPTR